MCQIPSFSGPNGNQWDRVTSYMTPVCQGSRAIQPGCQDCQMSSARCQVRSHEPDVRCQVPDARWDPMSPALLRPPASTAVTILRRAQPWLASHREVTQGSADAVYILLVLLMLLQTPVFPILDTGQILQKCRYYAGIKSQTCGYITEKMLLLCRYFKRCNTFSSLSTYTKCSLHLKASSILSSQDFFFLFLIIIYLIIRTWCSIVISFFRTFLQLFLKVQKHKHIANNNNLGSTAFSRLKGEKNAPYLSMRDNN